MSNWRDRIIEMLSDERAYTKERFLRSVLAQGDRCGWQFIPSPAQAHILGRMYKAYTRRRVEDILGCTAG